MASQTPATLSERAVLIRDMRAIPDSVVKRALLQPLRLCIVGCSLTLHSAGLQGVLLDCHGTAVADLTEMPVYLGHRYENFSTLVRILALYGKRNSRDITFQDVWVCRVKGRVMVRLAERLSVEQSSSAPPASRLAQFYVNDRPVELFRLFKHTNFNHFIEDFLCVWAPDRRPVKCPEELRQSPTPRDAVYIKASYHTGVPGAHLSNKASLQLLLKCPEIHTEGAAIKGSVVRISKGVRLIGGVFSASAKRSLPPLSRPGSTRARRTSKTFSSRCAVGSRGSARLTGAPTLSVPATQEESNIFIGEDASKNTADDFEEDITKLYKMNE